MSWEHIHQDGRVWVHPPGDVCDAPLVHKANQLGTIHLGPKEECVDCVPPWSDWALPDGAKVAGTFTSEEPMGILTEEEMKAGVFISKQEILSLDADRWTIKDLDREERVAEAISRIPVNEDGGVTISKFETKDSGDRIVYDSGMVRDTQKGKARFDLLVPLGVPYEEQFLTRVALLMARGAEKYGERNWEKAEDDVELGRAKASALRHLMQWLAGETDEDHAAAVVFNLNEVETIKYKQRVASASIVTTEVER